MQHIPITPDMIAGAISIEAHAHGLQPWRIPQQQRHLYFPALVERASTTAGIRLQLETDASSIAIIVSPDNESSRHFDICADNQLLQTLELPAGEDVLRFENIPGDATAVDIWLPQRHQCVLKELRMPEHSSCSARKDKRLHWLHYGSSISHCGEAHSPARTWPAIVARHHDLHLTCLGYGGNCHLETMIARMIRDQQFDLATFKIGINVQGNGSLNQRTWQEQVIGLIECIREKHPDTPLGIITSICSPPREDNRNAVGMSLNDYRAGVREAVKRIKTYSDAPLELFEGLDVFGPDLVDYLPDKLHPNGDGYVMLGNNIADTVVTPILKKHFSKSAAG